MSADLASVFQPAAPAMIVGHSVADGVPPLGLGEPFALLGGDRLGPAGIPFLVGHEWQPAFLHAIRTACDDLLAAGRPWFRMPPALLAGGEGRSHAARSLARAAGVHHIFLNISHAVIGACISGSTDFSEALWVSPIVTAMAATQCANPVVSVIGADVNADAAVALASMLDPVLGRAWMEEKIGTVVDLGEVTWLVQADSLERLPTPLADKLMIVPMKEVAIGEHDEILVSLLAEVLADLGISPADPTVAWANIVERVRTSQPSQGEAPRFRSARPRLWTGAWRSPRDMYDQLRTAVIEAQYDAAAARLGGPFDIHQK